MLNTREDMATGVLARLTTFLLQAVVYPLPNTTQLSTSSIDPRDAACRRLETCRMFNPKFFTDFAHGIMATLEV
jgi:hypothetical protein